MTAKLLRLPESDRIPRDSKSEQPFAGSMSLPQLAAAICRGNSLADGEFDQFLRPELVGVSQTHWTPVAVAMRVAEWIHDLGLEQVVDIGSGAGKFCIVAALASGARFIGIEQRPNLVSAARVLAKKFQVEDRVQFISGTFGEDLVPAADAYYFYNPFGENLYGASAQIDRSVDFGLDRYAHDVTAAEQFLRRAPPGTNIFTYNGFGGRVPSNYATLRVDFNLPNLLRMWRKTGRRA
jgi:hypothetical protein